MRAVVGARPEGICLNHWTNPQERKHQAVSLPSSPSEPSCCLFPQNVDLLSLMQVPSSFDASLDFNAAGSALDSTASTTTARSWREPQPASLRHHSEDNNATSTRFKTSKTNQSRDESAQERQWYAGAHPSLPARAFGPRRPAYLPALLFRKKLTGA